MDDCREVPRGLILLRYKVHRFNKGFLGVGWAQPGGQGNLTIGFASGSMLCPCGCCQNSNLLKCVPKTNANWPLWQLPSLIGVVAKAI